MVLDLVHPSLFPLIYGRSRILESGTVGIDDCVRRCGEGKTISIPEPYDKLPEAVHLISPDVQASNAWSSKFQWLPCDVKFLEGSEEVKLVPLFAYSILVRSADS